MLFHARPGQLVRGHAAQGLGGLLAGLLVRGRAEHRHQAHHAACTRGKEFVNLHCTVKCKLEVLKRAARV